MQKVVSDLVVVGGGITGLCAAYLSARKGYKVTVLEAGENFGGLLSTFEIGGNRLEYYYHHFFTHDKELNWLIKELKIQDRLFFRKTSMGVFRDGRIYPFNTAIDLLRFSPIAFFDKLRFGLTSLFLANMASWRKFESISCIGWFNKWAGKSTTISLWAPLLKVKFGPFASQVPLSWMIGRLRQRMNSRKNGDERLGYLNGSLQVLLDALLTELRKHNVTLINKAPVDKINISNSEIVSISVGSEEFLSKKFLFTVPGIYLSPMLKDAPLLGLTYERVEYFGAICVVLELDRPFSDIYWLNIADEGFPFGGIIEHTNFVGKENYNGSHIIYLSRYFAKEEDIATMTNDVIKDLMINKLCDVNKKFDVDWIKSTHIFRTNTAAPVCDLNFSEKVPSCKTQIPGLFVSNMSHVYPDERSTNNSIRIAMNACRVMELNTEYFESTNSLSGKIGF